MVAPLDQENRKCWRQGFWVAHTLLLLSLPREVRETEALVPYFGEDQVMFPLGLMIRELERVFVKILVSVESESCKTELTSRLYRKIGPSPLLPVGTVLGVLGDNSSP